MSDQLGISVTLDAELARFEQKMRDAGRVVETSTTGMDKATKRAQASFGRLEGALDPAARALQRLDRDTRRVQDAVSRGAVSNDRAAQVQRRLNDQYEQTIARLGGVTAAQARVTAGVTAGARATQAAGTGTARFGSMAQNASYQIGDFAVQVASGTSATRALTQQLPQLLGGFGLVGAAIGAAVAVGGALAPVLFGIGDAAEEAGDEADTAADRFDRLREIMEELRGTAQLTDAALRASADGVVRLIELDLNRAERRVEQLRAATQQAAAEEAARLSGLLVDAEGAVGDGATPELREAEAAARDLRLELLLAQAEAGAFGDRFSVNARHAAEALQYVEEQNEDSAKQAAAAIGEVEEAWLSFLDSLDKQADGDVSARAAEALADAEASSKAIVQEWGSFLDAQDQAADQAIEAALRRRDQAQEQIARALGSAARATKRLQGETAVLSGRMSEADLAVAAMRDSLVDAGVAGEQLTAVLGGYRAALDDLATAQERSKRAQDAQNAATKAQREAARAAEQAMQEQQRALERFADRSSTILADSLLSSWTDDTFDFWDSFERIGLSAIANFVATAATEEFVVPIYAEIVGRSGQGSGQASSGGSSGGMDMPNGMLDQFSGEIDQFGVDYLGFGGSTVTGSGLPASTFFSGAAPAFSSSSSALAATGPLGGAGTLAGTATGSTGGAVGAAGLGGGVSGAGVGLAGVAGGIGAGFGAGMMVNGLLGGDETAGMVGSAGGALAGAAIGSVIPGVGTVVGALIGGLIGGGGSGLLFGSTPTVGPNSQARGTLYGGMVGLTDSGADNDGDIERSVGLLTDLSQALNRVNEATAADIGAQEARISIMEESGQITVEAAGHVGVFTDEADALLFGVQALTGNMAGLDAEMERVVRQAGSLDQAIANLEVIRAIDELRTFFGETTRLEAAVGELNARYDALTEAAERLSLSEGRRLRILEAQTRELASLRGGFEADIERQMLALTNSGSASLLELQDALVETLRDAAAVGADLVAVEELYGARRLAEVQRFSEAQLRALAGGSQLDRSLSAYEQARRDIERALGDIEAPFQAFVAAAHSFRDNLETLLDGLRLDQSISPLSPGERMATAEAAFERDLAAALGGDAEAVARIGQTTQAFLAESASFNASTMAHAANFDRATGALEGLGVSLGGEIDVQTSQLDRLTEIRDLLASPAGIDMGALQAALSAAGINVSTAGLAQAQASAQSEIGNSNRDALQEAYAQARDAARAGEAGAVPTFVSAARRLLDLGAIDRGGVNQDAADIRERGFDVPSFARGGYHGGGLRLVGEEGPELEFTGPSRILPAGETAALMGNSGELRQEVAGLRSDNRALIGVVVGVLEEIAGQSGVQSETLDRLRRSVDTLSRDLVEKAA